MLSYRSCVSCPFLFKVMKVLQVALFACHSLWLITGTPNVALVSVSKHRMALVMFTTRPNVINKVSESLSLSSLLPTGSVISHFKLNRH